MERLAYLFLESLLSARESFYISYVGQSIRDNSTLPPSVVVNELMDYAEQGFDLKEGGLLNAVVRQQRLQAFSPEYYRGGGTLFSYSQENLQAARSQARSAGAPEKAHASVRVIWLCESKPAAHRH